MIRIQPACTCGQLKILMAAIQSALSFLAPAKPVSSFKRPPPIALIGVLSPIKSLDTVKTTSHSPAGPLKNRRRSHRYECEGNVEVNRIPSTGKRQGKLKDLSKDGCFIAMEHPFANPSYVEITINHRSTRLRLTGTVKSSRKTGIGVEFANISSSGKILLQELITELEHSRSQSPERSV
jgi:hypothetical protein